MKPTDLITYTPVFEVNGVSNKGKPVEVTVAEFIALIGEVDFGTIVSANKVANIAAAGSDFANLAAVTTAYNNLLAALKTAGVMTAD